LFGKLLRVLNRRTKVSNITKYKVGDRVQENKAADRLVDKVLRDFTGRRKWF
jgi:hypothetical protein